MRSAPSVEYSPYVGVVEAYALGRAGPSLLGNRTHRCDHPGNGLEPRQVDIVDIVPLAVRFHELLRLSKIVARETRPDVVLNLELQPTVEPVEPLWA